MIYSLLTFGQPCKNFLILYYKNSSIKSTTFTIYLVVISVMKEKIILTGQVHKNALTRAFMI